MYEIATESDRDAQPRARRAPIKRRWIRIALLLFGIYLGFGAAIAWSTVRAKPSRHDSTPSALRLPFESVSFHSSDGTELSGWLVKRRNPTGIVILCHGVDSTRSAMLDVAEMLHRHGFSSLLFDFRARGESGGSRCTIGFREVDDLLAAIRFVRHRPELSHLSSGVLGESMGGAVALMCAARNQDIAAVVAESPFAVLSNALDNHFRSLGPTGPFLGAPARWIGERLIGCGSADVAPVREIAKISPRPILLIQDAEDYICPPSETSALMDAAGEPKELWTVPDSAHIGARDLFAEEYERRITDFFKQHLSLRE